MNSLEYVFGEVCKILLPIPEEVYFGNQKSSIAICTLSSISLLKEIAESNLLDNVAIVGRLFSENKGIDALVRFVNSNPNIKTLILCGKEVWGHKAGESLLALYENGIDSDGRIIGSHSPDPISQLSNSEVQKFQNQITIINKTGETDPLIIKQTVDLV
ncbi:MAG: tetrahydromethanopterin S-methyltransferase subunit A [Crenarchaeota archaeon]|nr:MAG: tetrahydromethanopterin S-methyltransferase subunit A [Thermoproteota archaeon]RDJ34478.1 MAG: tetrahydromethanopterin S-methyltransferase subunit A [Thermoproteota archaeon]RDJ34816.1 MAG: tetrahydromethanopterin S-methyltransferase subunit A [Thermoproteota archaeon]RDJ38580.1 MAG: tetrahydromethanopterin S-methyltransferase subunit A [Thermoproteota archaeon]